MFFPRLGTKMVLRLSNLVYLRNTINVYTDESIMMLVIVVLF